MLADWVLEYANDGYRKLEEQKEFPEMRSGYASLSHIRQLPLKPSQPAWVGT